MKHILILPRDRYKSPTLKYRTSQHIKGSTRLAPMNQYETDRPSNTSNQNLNIHEVALTKSQNGNASFDSSLHQIIPLVIPSKEKSVELTGKRLELQNIIVKKICPSEIEGILNMSFEFLSEIKTSNISPQELFKSGNESTDFNNILKRNKIKYFKGEFTPQSNDFVCQLSEDDRRTILSSFHTIDSLHYLHFTSDNLYKSLSTIFNVEMSDKHIYDPNPVLNTMINVYQEDMVPFLSPYLPYKKISFPFIISVSGPSKSGKTTVCQFLQKAFTAHIIRANYAVPEKKKPPTSLKNSDEAPTTKTSADAVNTSMMITELANPSVDNEDYAGASNAKPMQYYPLSDTHEFTYSDDKSAVNSIVTMISSIMAEDAEKEEETDFGFIIEGFPTNKKQHSLLEKTLTAKGISMHERQIKHMIVPPSQRQRAAMTCIDGLIVTTASSAAGDKKDATSGSKALMSRKRLIDPETGNVYRPGFHMPGICDLVGVSPPFFAQSRKEIESRLEEVPDSEDDEASQKVVQKFIQFESALHKGYKSVNIGFCDDSLMMLDQLDQFIFVLFKNVIDLIPSSDAAGGRIRPMTTLLSPISLIRPEMTFTAMSSWSQCVEEFGKQISDQTQLVNSLTEKVETLQKVSRERYQLLISQKDKRIDVCSHFVEELKNKLNLNRLLAPIQSAHSNESLNQAPILPPKNKSKINPRFRLNKFSPEVEKDSLDEENKSIDKIEMKELNDFLSDHFRNIWDLSISTRTKNLELVDDIVYKSGLIELALEFRKSPKKFFIFLVHRMIYVKWFFDNFSYINEHKIDEQAQSSFFDDLQLRNIEIPKVNLQLSHKPASIKKFQSMFTIDKLELQKRRDAQKNDNLLKDNSNINSDSNSANIGIIPMINTNIHTNINDNNHANIASTNTENKNKISHMKSYALGTNKFDSIASAGNANFSFEQNANGGPETSRPIHKPAKNAADRRAMAEIQGFKYLEENFASFSKRPDDEIFFDSDSACRQLGILKFTPSLEASFDRETQKYAEEFFNHVFVSFDGKPADGEEEKSVGCDLNSLMSNEAQIGLKFFRKFSTACRRKEASMVNSVLDLQDSLDMFANSKTSREMEKFSKRFRQLKSFVIAMAERINNFYESTNSANSNETSDESSKTHHLHRTAKRTNYCSPFELRKRKEKLKNAKNFPLEDNKAVLTPASIFSEDEIDFVFNLSADDLFEYDIDLIGEDVKFLAEIALAIDPPLYLQALVPFDDIAEVACEVITNGLFFPNVDDFLDAAKKTKIGQLSLMMIELCLRVSECVECFDVKQFLLLFARSENDEIKLNDIFKKPVKPNKNALMDNLSTFMRALTTSALAMLPKTKIIDVINGKDDDDEVEEEEEDRNEEEEEEEEEEENISDNENEDDENEDNENENNEE